jgi:cobalt-zinc-cadmium efflux system protein
MDVASAHLSLEPSAELGAVLATAREALHEDFAIDHATLQVEPVGAGGPCAPTGW